MTDVTRQCCGTSTIDDCRCTPPTDATATGLKEAIARICFAPDRQSLHNWNTARGMAESTPRSCTGACVREAYKRADRILALLASASVVGEREAKWRERWYGSEPQKGSAIVDERGNLIAYFGGDEVTHKATTTVVAAHNAALAAPETPPTEGEGK